MDLHCGGMLSGIKNDTMPMSEQLLSSRDRNVESKRAVSSSIAWAELGFSRYMDVTSCTEYSPLCISPAMADRAKACPLSLCDKVKAELLSDSRFRPILFFKRKSRNSAPVSASQEVTSTPEAAGSNANKRLREVMIALPFFDGGGQVWISLSADSTLSKMMSNLHSTAHQLISQLAVVTYIFAHTCCPEPFSDYNLIFIMGMRLCSWKRQL